MDGPFLEIHQYTNQRERTVPGVNEPGYSHLSFQVKDINAARLRVPHSGGAKLGEITNFGTPETPVLVFYMLYARS